MKNTTFAFKTITNLICMVFLISMLAVGATWTNSYGFAGTFSEKIFAMSWEELSTLSDTDFTNMLEQESILYREEEGSIVTNSGDTFMGNDCLFKYYGISKGMLLSDYDSQEMQTIEFAVAFATDEDYKASRKLLEHYLKEHLIKGSDVFIEQGNGKICYRFLVEVSDQNMNKFLEHKDKSALEEHFAERNIELEECSIYKFVRLQYVQRNAQEGFQFADEKSYIDDLCMIGVEYWLMAPEEYINMAAYYGYDSIEEKAIDLDVLKDMLDEEIIGAIVRSCKNDNFAYCEESEKQRYIQIYMIEKHNFDRKRMKYLKTIEEKKLWYIWYYQWDIDKKEYVELSRYQYSPQVYCAVVYCYNVDTGEYFQSDFERALYLADKNYNIETGEDFESAREMCLWFMQNFAYDTFYENTVGSELAEALIAYQEYIDGIPDAETVWQGYNLIYFDEDDIPELLASATCQAGGRMLLIWQNGVIQEARLDRLGGLRYVEKKNVYCNTSAHMGYYFTYYYKLENGRQITIAEGNSEDKRDETGNYIIDEATGYFEQEFFWNGTECSQEEFEYQSRVIEAEAGVSESDWKYVPEEQYADVLSAYHALEMKTE